MRFLIEKIIQKRNPFFKFSNNVSDYDVFLFVIDLSLKVIRGVLFHRMSPVSLSVIGNGVKLVNRRYLKIGSRIKLDDNVYIDSLGLKGVVIGDNVSIGAFTRIVVSSSFTNLGVGVTINSGVGIGEFSRIGGSGGVLIGENTIIGQYLSCHPENHNFENLELDIKFQGTNRAEIVIGKNCWVGSKVTICAGVKIGDGSVIGAGAVVTKSVPENSIVAGNPAKVLRMRGRDE